MNIETLEGHRDCYVACQNNSIISKSSQISQPIQSNQHSLSVLPMPIKRNKRLKQIQWSAVRSKRLYISNVRNKIEKPLFFEPAIYQFAERKFKELKLMTNRSLGH